MERAVGAVRRDLDKEVLNRIQRMRNQLQAIIIAAQEIAIQLSELVQSVNGIILDVRSMEEELNRLKDDRKRKTGRADGK